MRLIPFLTAIGVVAILYALVFERPALMAFAQVETQTAEEAAPEVGEEVRRVSVVALRSTAQSVEDAIVLRGETEASRQVDVRAETSGLIISPPLRAGAMITEGDLLCELDPGTRQSSLDEALARLEEARARLPEAQARIPEAEARKAEAETRLAEAQARVAEAEGRVVEARARLAEAEINQNAAARLSEDGFASETRVANADAQLESARAGLTSALAAVEGAEAGIVGAQAGVVGADAGVEGAAAAVESARAAIQSAEAGVAAAERELERLKIMAPFDGILESDSAELGSLLQPGSACATVIQLDPIKIVGFVPETQVDRVVVGARAAARLASGQEVVGEVTFISRSADQTTRTFKVEITVPNADSSIRDGLTAEILVETAGSDAHLLPQSALTLDDQGNLGVRIVTEDETAGFAEVRLLRDQVDGVLVDGLGSEAQVIIVGQEFVTDGVPLRISWQGEEASQ